MVLSVNRAGDWFTIEKASGNRHRETKAGKNLKPTNHTQTPRTNPHECWYFPALAEGNLSISTW